jgi:predicted phosphate transport protein (TIGR00153 family)
MLLRLFRSWMPRDENFVERLCQHSRYVVDGAGAFRSLFYGGDAEAHYADLCRFEEAADAVTQDIIRAIHRTFITPFDRSQILDLTTALDDTIDLMKEAGRRVRLYGIDFTPEMQGMADCAVRATIELREAMPLLGSIGRSVDRLNAMQAGVRRAESDADDLLAQGLRRVFASDTSPGYKLTVEKVYDLIEAVVDRCEDVADVIEGIVVEQV